MFCRAQRFTARISSDYKKPGLLISDLFETLNLLLFKLDIIVIINEIYRMFKVII